MFFGLLIVGFTLLVLTVGIGGYALMAFGAGRAASKRYRAIVFFGVCLLPFAYYWVGQWRLGAICDENARPAILEKRSDVEGFYFRGPYTYGFVSGPVLFAGFSYLEREGDLTHKYRRIVDIDDRKSIYSNELSSTYDVVVSSPSLYSAIWSIYSQEMVVRERSTGKVLGKMTDYLWGAPVGTVRAWYAQLFLGRSFVSCGPGLKKGLANDGIWGQGRQDEYLRRDANFLESVLRSKS